MKIQKFGHISNSVDNGIIILNQDLKVFFWNEWLERRTHISSSDIKNKNLKDFFPNLNDNKLKRKINTSLKLNSPTFYSTEINRFLLEIPLHNVSSRIFDFMQQAVTISPYDLEENTVVLYLYDNTLLSESNHKLKEAKSALEHKNKELKQSTNKLQTSLVEIELLLNTTMEAIFLFENDICTQVNDKAIELFEYNNASEIKNKSIKELIVSDANNQLSDILTKPLEVKLLKKDDISFDALIQTKRIKLNEKNIKVITVIDLTSLKVKDKLLANQSKMAAMGEMIENIAHQWRQPLSTISTAASGIKLQKELGILKDKMFNDATNIIIKSSKHLSQTINDFQNFLKGDKEKVLFNVKKNIEKSLSILEGILKANHIEVILSCENNIDLLNYPNELTQAMLNIITNAKDALVENDIENKYIFIEAYIKNSFVIIKIKDNARGINEDIIKKIFEPYFTTKHKNQGTGLGLYMTHQLIKISMNGSIDVKNESYSYENESFKGSCFKIQLPIVSYEE